MARSDGVRDGLFPALSGDQYSAVPALVPTGGSGGIHGGGFFERHRAGRGDVFYAAGGRERISYRAIRIAARRERGRGGPGIGITGGGDLVAPGDAGNAGVEPAAGSERAVVALCARCAAGGSVQGRRAAGAGDQYETIGRVRGSGLG